MEAQLAAGRDFVKLKSVESLEERLQFVSGQTFLFTDADFAILEQANGDNDGLKIVQAIKALAEFFGDARVSLNIDVLSNHVLVVNFDADVITEDEGIDEEEVEYEEEIIYAEDEEEIYDEDDDLDDADDDELADDAEAVYEEEIEPVMAEAEDVSASDSETVEPVAEYADAVQEEQPVAEYADAAHDEQPVAEYADAVQEEQPVAEYTDAVQEEQPVAEMTPEDAPQQDSYQQHDGGYQSPYGEDNRY
jgi:hypothetical protein